MEVDSVRPSSKTKKYLLGLRSMVISVMTCIPTCMNVSDMAVDNSCRVQILMP